MTLHRHKVDDRTEVRDGDQPVHVPAGWQIADGSADDVRVCGAHPWQSNELVFANGDTYGTEMCSTPWYIGALSQPTRWNNKILSLPLKIGRKWGSGEGLIQDAQEARGKYGGYDVLLRRRA
jgi:hypothetical protein